MQGNTAKNILKNFGGQLERLNVHSHHGCNLRCSGCNHHSEFVDATESIDIEQTIKDLSQLISIINIRVITVLGGEPLINSSGTKDICEFLLDKKQKTKLVTNGFYLNENKEWLIPAIKKGLILKISLHLSKNDKGGNVQRDKIKSFLEIANQHNIELKSGTNIFINQQDGWIEVSPEWKRKKEWFHIFKYNNDKVYPYDSNKENAFKICESNCPQLYKGKLFKCAHSAYLNDILSIKEQLNDSFWKKYNYVGYNIYDAKEVINFLNTVYEPEDICSSCPETPTYITKNQDYSITKKIIPIYD